MNNIKDDVKEYYGRVLSGTKDLKTKACCCSTDSLPEEVKGALSLIDDEIISHYYGCGSPIPPLLDGMTVLDLGCGSGRDVYVVSKLVGENGHVIGIDMTQEQLNIAKRHEENQKERFGYEKSKKRSANSFLIPLNAIVPSRYLMGSL